MTSTRIQWLLWAVLSLGLCIYFAMSLISQPAAISKTFLPGATTAGHYQIELRCDVCHTPGMGVRQESCLECHAEELKLAKDTHPATKFIDPANAVLLEVLDATKCITCHEEHVPDRTHPMGLSLPTDYCYRCHADIGEERPSHEGMAFDSCASSGCHNFHDNLALYENYLAKHFEEDDLLEEAKVPARDTRQTVPEDQIGEPLEQSAYDVPEGFEVDQLVIDEWAASTHAQAGVNCTACHVGDEGAWSDRVEIEMCQSCHKQEAEGFLAGRHGMRLSLGLPAMRPAEARQAMHEDASHKELNCNSCHGAHDYTTQEAAVESCLTCHSDQHSMAYKKSVHFELWQAETHGEAEVGTGVSCATCHLPRVIPKDDSTVRVVHNQNDNLRPNEKMVRSVCANCHGLQFTLDSLVDQELIEENFSFSPSKVVESVDMAHHWLNRRKKQEKRTSASEETASTRSKE